MFYQLEYSDVINNFLDNDEYLNGFVSALGIDGEHNNLTGTLFENHEFVKWTQRSPTIEGFVIENPDVQYFVISPSKNYMGFWGHRNFFTWRLAQRHSWKNDNKTRYVINFIYKSENNRVDTFNNIKNFFVINLYIENITDDLQQWLQALYKEV